MCRDRPERLDHARRHGELDYQRYAAARTVRDLLGVKGVTNAIVLKPQVNTTDVRDKIEAAFKRSAEVDARRVSVVAEDGKIILSGNVHSWAERQEAERRRGLRPGSSSWKIG